jgi:hypothetical protein
VPVEVSNADPIQVRDTGMAARQVFRFSGTLHLTDFTGELPVVTVPDGKRLVVEQISWRCGTGGLSEVTSADLRGTLGSVTHRYMFKINPPHNGYNEANPVQDGSEQIRAYFEAGEQVKTARSADCGEHRQFRRFHPRLPLRIQLRQPQNGRPPRPAFRVRRRLA